MPYMTVFIYIYAIMNSEVKIQNLENIIDGGKC
jgi:hypothetical protein